MFEGKTLSLTTLDNDYAEIKFDSQSGSVNKFNAETLAELRQAMDILKQQQGIKGLLLSSGKSVFVVGADITEFKGMFSASKEQFVEAAYVVNALFSEIEDLPYPSVAAINGFALGGGFEVCLACDCRVISSKAAVGLPETGLGIIPGWGWTDWLCRCGSVDCLWSAAKARSSTTGRCCRCDCRAGRVARRVAKSIAGNGRWDERL
jgi:3-hydroxyacyl-CoA dehydrogenase/enoyl-CoA hydratase/3-hydroxybutyryl-CoA epimerase/enoyl-CoA isomerase